MHLTTTSINIRNVYNYGSTLSRSKKVVFKHTSGHELANRANIEFNKGEAGHQRTLTFNSTNQLNCPSGNSKVLKMSVQPPTILFHGTSSRFIKQIKHEGLKPRERQYVHLSVDQETALLVAKRK